MAGKHSKKNSHALKTSKVVDECGKQVSAAKWIYKESMRNHRRSGLFLK